MRTGGRFDSKSKDGGTGVVVGGCSGDGEDGFGFGDCSGEFVLCGYNFDGDSNWIVGVHSNCILSIPLDSDSF